MTRIILAIGLCFFLITSKTYACDCEYQGSFIKMTQYTSLVAYVKVTKYLTFNEIYNTKTPMSMEVEIIEVYKGKESRKTITVWGDIGNLCRPYLSQFKEGQYYVIAFYSGRYGGSHPNEKETDYSIANCGAYWLTVDFEKSTVTGDIDSKERISTTINISELKAKLSQNGY
jgi:hypothetical protein